MATASEKKTWVDNACTKTNQILIHIAFQNEQFTETDDCVVFVDEDYTQI